ncbi:HAD hydrolase-like protein [Candidatus Woesearchaeota archaeon]|nr:HAD hydrolase-like protein [Candidatus Woesearchaeota archaeon]
MIVFPSDIFLVRVLANDSFISVLKMKQHMNPFAYSWFWISFFFGKKKIKLSTSHYQSIYDIDYEALHKKGIKLLIFDFDDTLTYDKGEISSKTKQLLEKLSKKFKLAIFTNSHFWRRRKIIAMISKLPIYVNGGSGKPAKKGFGHLLDHYHIQPKNAAMIGDKLVMDLWGAYNTGMEERILVEPYSEIFGGKKANVLDSWLRNLEKKICSDIYFLHDIREK